MAEKYKSLKVKELQGKTKVHLVKESKRTNEHQRSITKAKFTTFWKKRRVDRPTCSRRSEKRIRKT